MFGAKIITQTAKCLELQTFASGGGLRLSCDEFADSRFFAMDMVLLENHIQPFTLLFREKETPLSAPEDVCVMSSIQPQLPVTWVLDFPTLQSHSLNRITPQSACAQMPWRASSPERTRLATKAPFTKSPSSMNSVPMELA